jgi:hypothetical protein
LCDEILPESTGRKPAAECAFRLKCGGLIIGSSERPFIYTDIPE